MQEFLEVVVWYYLFPMVINTIVIGILQNNKKVELKASPQFLKAVIYMPLFNIFLAAIFVGLAVAQTLLKVLILIVVGRNTNG